MPVKPSEAEEEYFARLEAHRRKTAELEVQKIKAEAERQRCKEMCYMKCPKCGADLVEIDYRDIKIDRCVGCQGAWLDAGELEAVQKASNPLLGKVFRVFKVDE